MSYHRHAGNVLSKVDMACGQFVLYYVIPAVMGRPKDASGCHCVLSLCHLMYCHLPNSSPWRLRRFTESKSHLITTSSCHCSVHMAHSKSPDNLSPSLFFHSLCIRSSLHSTPCRPHRPFPGPLASVVRSIHGGARGKEPLHRGGVPAESRPVQWCPTSGAEGLGDVNGWRAPPRGSPPPTPTAVGETAICGVKSVSFIFFKIV